MTDRLCSICNTPLKPRQMLQCSRACQTAAFAKRSRVNSEEQIARAAELRAQGWTMEAISLETGMHRSSVWHLIRTGQVPTVPKPRAVSAFPKLRSPEQDEIVLQMYPAGVAFDAIQAAVNAAGAYELKNSMALREWAGTLGVKRPAGWQKTGGMVERQRTLAQRASIPERRHIAVVEAPKKGRTPRTVSLAMLCRIGRELGLSPEAALDVAKVSAAQRKAEPGHGGYVLETYRGAWERAA